jgi:hypothetical protein
MWVMRLAEVRYAQDMTKTSDLNLSCRKKLSYADPAISLRNGGDAAEEFLECIY